jgi:erythromycin esterase-like protein
LIAAGGEPARKTSVGTAIDRRRRDHEVSILIAAGGGEGRCSGSHPRAKVSMTIMRPPQHGLAAAGRAAG